MSAPQSLAFATIAKGIDRAFHEAPHAAPALILERVLSHVIDHAANARDLPAATQFRALRDTAIALLQDRSVDSSVAYITGAAFAEDIAETLLEGVPEIDQPQAILAAHSFARACKPSPQQSRHTFTDSGPSGDAA